MATGNLWPLRVFGGAGCAAGDAEKKRTVALSTLRWAAEANEPFTAYKIPEKLLRMIC